LSIAATAATPHTMDNKEIDSRKRRRIIDDDEDDDDNEASNDEDDDEVGDKSSNRPGIYYSLACTNKGEEKRSGPSVVNVARGCNSPPPPHPGQEQEQERI
jgi:hypothetical protein